MAWVSDGPCSSKAHDCRLSNSITTESLVAKSNMGKEKQSSLIWKKSFCKTRCASVHGRNASLSLLHPAQHYLIN